MPTRFAALALLLVACASKQPFYYTVGAIDGLSQPLEPVDYLFQTRTLPSGLRIGAFQFPGTPSMELRASWSVGPLPPGQEGLPLVAGVLLDHAAPGRGGLKLGERRFASGAFSSTSGDVDELVSSAYFKESQLATQVKIESDRMADPTAELTEAMVRNALEAVAVDLERKMERSHQQELAAWGIAFAGTRYAGLSPTPASIRALTAAQVLAFIKATVVPARAILVVVGGGAPQQTLARVNDNLSGTAEGNPKAPVVPVRFDDLARPAAQRTGLLPGPWRSPDRRLVMVWPLPVDSKVMEARILAMTLKLRDTAVRRLTTDERLSGVAEIHAHYREADGAGTVILSMELKKEAKAEEVRASIDTAAREMLQRKEWRDPTVRAEVELERFRESNGRIPIWELARAYRTSGQPVPERIEPRPEAAAFPGGAVALAESWFRPENATAVLFEQEGEAAPKPQAESMRERPADWETWVAPQGLAAPGRGQIARLVTPPGLDKAVRERLANGMEAILLPGGPEPFVSIQLLLPEGAAVGRERLRAQQAFRELRLNLPRSCVIGTADVGFDGAQIRTTIVSGAARFGLEAISCWTLDLDTVFPVGVRNQPPVPSDRGLRLLEERGGLPPSDEASDWAEPYLRRAVSPSRAQLIVTGKFDAAQMLRWIRMRFGTWKPPAGRQVPRQQITTARQRVVVVTDVEKAQDGWVHVAYFWQPAGQDDVVRRNLATALLQRKLQGETQPGHVELELTVLRTREPIEYLAITLSGRSDRLGTALGKTLAALGRLKDAEPDAATLALARWDTAMWLAYRLDTLNGRAAALTVQAVSGELPGSRERDAERLAAIEASAVRAYFEEVPIGREVIRVAGDASIIVPALRALGLDPVVIPAEKRDGKK